ncbi:MAG: hypothetical protein ACK559_09345, partial [bacterium]
MDHRRDAGPRRHRHRRATLGGIRVGAGGEVGIDRRDVVALDAPDVDRLVHRDLLAVGAAVRDDALEGGVDGVLQAVEGAGEGAGAGAGAHDRIGHDRLGAVGVVAVVPVLHVAGGQRAFGRGVVRISEAVGVGVEVVGVAVGGVVVH